MRVGCLPVFDLGFADIGAVVDVDVEVAFVTPAPGVGARNVSLVFLE